MKKNLLFLALLLSSAITYAQLLPDEDPGCRQKCNHAHLASRLYDINYQQYASMDKYDVKYLKLDITVEAGSRFIEGNALTVARVLQPLDSFITEFRNNMTVDSVYINGIKRSFQRGADHIFVPLSPALPTGSQFSALVFYKGTASSGAVFAGTVGSSGLTYSASLSESYQAREWFPAKQILRDKIDSADIWITTSDFNKAGSNGLLVNTVAKPNNKVQYQWKTRYPMNYYLPSFSVGNYMEYLNYAKPLAMAPDSILVQHYIANDVNYFNSVKTNLDKTPAFIEKYSELFGLYPFANEKYGHAQASIGGGMEHQTMSTMNSFGSTLIAHELGHQWWGDNVTCATWNHIWLNEGFASYCEYLAIEKRPDLFPTTNLATYMQNVHNSVMGSPGGSVFVPDASIFDEGRIFSGRLSYNKGSAIIHTLRFELQDDAVFFQALQDYQVQYKDSVATAEDFKLVVETRAGRNLNDFFNQWYYGEGYPTFNVTYIKEPTDSITLIIGENTSMPGITPFFKGYFQFTITSAQGDTTVLVNLATNNQQFRFKYNKVPTGIIVDPNNWVLNQTGVITNGTVIPLQLTSFTGKTDDNCNSILNWKAINERAQTTYIVEYSADGVSFYTAGEVDGTVAPEYQFTFKPPFSGLQYYRLNMKDSNGNHTYSNTIQIIDRCGYAFQVTIKPNPVREVMKINITLPVSGSANFLIYNSTGQLIYKEKRTLNAGINLVELDQLQPLAHGVYLLKVQDEQGNKVSQKFVKE